MWKRALDIDSLNDQEGKLAIFSDKVEPNDIKQGALGDCYFLSILSVLSEHSDRIINLFETKQMND